MIDFDKQARFDSWALLSRVSIAATLPKQAVETISFSSPIRSWLILKWLHFSTLLFSQFQKAATLQGSGNSNTNPTLFRNASRP